MKQRRCLQHNNKWRNMKNICIEEWRAVVGYEGLYEVSSFGRVKSLPKVWLKYDGTPLRQKERILKERPTRNGYLRVCLRKNGKSTDAYIHRLVCEAFLPNPHSFSDVNHKDENKLNNHIENLEWCSRSFNNNYGSHNEKSAISRGKPVAKYSLSGKLLKTYPSARSADRDTGIDQSLIGLVCKGVYKQAGGFIWKFIV